MVQANKNSSSLCFIAGVKRSVIGAGSKKTSGTQSKRASLRWGGWVGG